MASVVRWINTGETGTTSAVVDTSAVAVGESMIVAMCIGSTTVTITPPAGWSLLFPKTTMGSRACVAYVRTKAGAGETTATFTASAATGLATALLGVVGALPATWIVGPVWTRSLHGTTLTNIADGVATDIADCVALVLSFEATTAVESPNTIAGVNNGFVELGYKAQSAIIETIWSGARAVPTAGDVGDTTITYRNTQASNGAAIMIGFHPAPQNATVTAVTARGGGRALAPSVTASARAVTPAATGSGTAHAPVTSASSTVTAPTARGTGRALAPTVSSSVTVEVPAATGSGTAHAPAVMVDAVVAAPTARGSGRAHAPTISVRRPLPDVTTVRVVARPPVTVVPRPSTLTVER